MTVITALLLLVKSQILNMQLVCLLTTVTNRIILSEVGFLVEKTAHSRTKTGHLVEVVC